MQETGATGGHENLAFPEARRHPKAGQWPVFSESSHPRPTQHFELEFDSASCAAIGFGAASAFSGCNDIGYLLLDLYGILH